MTRTRVRRWAPPLLQSLRLALRPAVAFLVFTVGGFTAFTGTALFYSHRSSELLEILLACFAGVVGVVLGQLGAILRVRSFPVLVVGGACVFFAVTMLALTGAASFVPSWLAPAVFFFLFALPCGLLSLQHRWELFASFWPAVGWIGSVFIVLNGEGRVREWEQEKASAWLPLPLFFLAAFLVLWLFYLSSKQAMRVELWQALSGAAARRVQTKATVTAVPRKNVAAILAVAAALFVATAVLAPYLWRTGKGNEPSDKQVEQHEEKEPRRAPEVDGEAVARMMKQLAEAAKNTALRLWPLLFLFLLYRPAKRALLSSHLLTPIVPTPPSERIDNLWEYVRIAAEDAGVVLHPSDSVEQLLVRVRGEGLGGPGLARAAGIYGRTRYGFTVAVGDPLAMRPAALEAARELRVRMTGWQRVKTWWRPLS